MDIKADSEAVGNWLIQYYAQCSFALASGEWQPPPKLSVLVDDQIIPTNIVDTLGRDTLVVCAPLSEDVYLSAILQQEDDWWLPVAIPKKVSHKEIFAGNVQGYLRLLNHLASPR